VGQDTSGFSQETTDVKKRDLGFVQPVAGPEVEPRGFAPSGGVNVKLRTPETPMDLGKAGRTERAARIDEDDLIASLPSPRPAGGDGSAPTRELPLPDRPPRLEPARQTDRPLGCDPLQRPALDHLDARRPLREELVDWRVAVDGEEEELPAEPLDLRDPARRVHAVPHRDE